MRVIPADPGRTVELPGVGPCPRPVDIDAAATGFRRLATLRVYRFAAGVEVHGESEGDEVFVIALAGRVALAVEGAHPLDAMLGPGRPGLYMPPGHGYRLVPDGDAVVAYARAAATGRVPTRQVAGARSDGLAEALGFALETLHEGGTLALGRTGERLVHAVSGHGSADGIALPEAATLALAPGETATLRATAPMRVLMLHA